MERHGHWQLCSKASLDCQLGGNCHTAKSSLCFPEDGLMERQKTTPLVVLVYSKLDPIDPRSRLTDLDTHIYPCMLHMHMGKDCHSHSLTLRC